MENPIDNPRNPNATLQEDVEDFVRDLAYGVVRLDWGFGHIAYDYASIFPAWMSHEYEPNVSHDKENFRRKWLNHAPNIEILVAYEYLTLFIPPSQQMRERPSYYYKLTSKAFDLLDRPAKRIRVFISYRRNQSSALALLVEARLRLKGVRDDHIFIDKSIEVGERWEAQIKKAVMACDYFIVLIAPKTLLSPNVQNEIRWASAENKHIIPICHGRMKAKKLSEDLQVLNAYEVKNESALDYEQGISHVLNELRFTTY